MDPNLSQNFEEVLEAFEHLDQFCVPIWNLVSNFPWKKK